MKLLNFFSILVGNFFLSGSGVRIRIRHFKNTHFFTTLCVKSPIRIRSSRLPRIHSDPDPQHYRFAVAGRILLMACSHLPPECVVIEQLVSGEVPLLASPTSPALCYLFSGAGSACLKTKNFFVANWNNFSYLCTYMIYTAPYVMFWCRQIHNEGKWEGLGPGNPRLLWAPKWQREINRKL